MEPLVRLRSPILLFAAAAVGCACTVTAPGGLGGSGGFGTGEPQCDPHNPDAQACPGAPAEPPGGCSVDADCCPGRQPGVASGEAPGCPDSYPNNWSCVNGNCVHGGCLTDGNCVLDGFTCEPVDGSVDACVHLCDDDTDCLEAQMPGAKCIGTIQASSQKYCLEDLS